MRVTIVGTGLMARAIATRALAGGHHVTFVGTHIGKAEDLAEELTGLGEVGASEDVRGDLVVLAVPFTAAPHVVRQHAAGLAGSVVVDVTNPVDIGSMELIELAEPPDIAPSASGAQVIAAAAPPGVPVVKAFNTTFAGPLLAGEVAGQPLNVFLAGDDIDAKARVGELALDGGLRPIDAGALRRAHDLEALGFLHMVIHGPLGTFHDTAIQVLEPPR